MKHFTALAALFLTLTTFTAGALDSAASGILKQLGISDAGARDNIRTAITSRSYYVARAASFKAVAAGDRAEIVRQLGQYTKDYTRTTEFKDAYLAHRNNGKPTAPLPAKTVDSINNEQKEQLRKAITDAEAGMGAVPPDMQAGIREMITMFRQQLKSLDDPKNPMFSPEMGQMLRQNADAEEKDYRQRLAQWERDYPETPDRMIRAWLEEFLTESKDVDFEAKLVPGSGGKMKFATPEYEKKTATWKMCYRAGREPVLAARAFAQSWLAELAAAK